MVLVYVLRENLSISANLATHYLSYLSTTHRLDAFFNRHNLDGSFCIDVGFQAALSRHFERDFLTALSKRFNGTVDALHNASPSFTVCGDVDCLLEQVFRL